MVVMSTILLSMVGEDSKVMKPTLCYIFFFLIIVMSSSYTKTEAAAKRSEYRGPCPSWRLAAETNNLRNWTPPSACISYVKYYMLTRQYNDDCNAAVYAAVDFLFNQSAAADQMDVWVFDIDETSLSNLPFYNSSNFQFNESLYEEWVKKEAAPAIPATLFLYKKLVSLGFKVVFLSGRTEAQRNATANNLLNQGYSSWSKLILREKDEEGRRAIEYKSNRRVELEKEGYNIIGMVGDQWSDLLGSSTGLRQFKIPNPLYYIS